MNPRDKLAEADMESSDPAVNETTAASSAWFKTTHWSSVLLAGRADAPQAEAALGRLCQTYWYPLYFYVRRCGHRKEDAQDLTQGFFARLLEKNYLKEIERDKGKFRSFLLMALKRFLANEWDKARRHKRGGGWEIVSLDDGDAEARYQTELADDRSPEKAYEQRWAATVLERVVNRLAAEMTAGGKAQLFDELKDLVRGEAGRASYPEVAQRLQMSEGTVRVNVHRLRRRYRELLREEIAETVDTPEAIEEEIRHLFATWA
jgi:RNA polymerase sigma factor (sigma-70 family)